MEKNGNSHAKTTTNRRRKNLTPHCFVFFKLAALMRFELLVFFNCAIKKKEERDSYHRK